MYCSQCGKELSGNAAFCSNCGAKTITENKHTTEETPFVNSSYHKTQTQTSQEKNGLVYVILGWVFFAISLLFIPILFGAGAFIMGFLTYKTRGTTHGVILMVMGVVGLLLGTLLGFIVGAAGY
ncbi:zinc-ribbon domain-containing protein [Radiobacillus sp. PE A8.2]|uniref:zinc-ribbon domain-containing protein n=1 Tax=Radiobacillus sp. PE A8.2 TaxID=3380349 RepID=UPI00388D3283